jgi:hypothetical protein
VCGGQALRRRRPATRQRGKATGKLLGSSLVATWMLHRPLQPILAGLRAGRGGEGRGSKPTIDVGRAPCGSPTLLPAPDARLGLAAPPHDLGRAAALGGGQDDPRPPGVLLAAVPVCAPRRRTMCRRSGPSSPAPSASPPERPSTGPSSTSTPQRNRTVHDDPHRLDLATPRIGLRQLPNQPTSAPYLHRMEPCLQL